MHIYIIYQGIHLYPSTNQPIHWGPRLGQSSSKGASPPAIGGTPPKGMMVYNWWKNPLLKHGMIWGRNIPLFSETPKYWIIQKKTLKRVWIDSISPWKWQGNWPRNLASTKLSVTPGSCLWASEIYQAVAHAAFLEKRFRMLIHADHLVGTKKNRKSGGLSVHNMIIMITICTIYMYIYKYGFGGVCHICIYI